MSVGAPGTPGMRLGAPGPETVRRLLAVAAGGAVGTLLRAGTVAAVPQDWSVAAIVVVNLLGAFLLGLLTGRVTRMVHRQFLLIGVLGSFTTFSTFVVDGVALVTRGLPVWWVVVHVVVTVVGGLWLAGVGLRLDGPPPPGARA